MAGGQIFHYNPPDQRILVPNLPTTGGSAVGEVYGGVEIPSDLGIGEKVVQLVMDSSMAGSIAVDGSMNGAEWHEVASKAPGDLTAAFSVIIRIPEYWKYLRLNGTLLTAGEIEKADLVMDAARKGAP